MKFAILNVTNGGFMSFHRHDMPEATAPALFDSFREANLPCMKNRSFVPSRHFSERHPTRISSRPSDLSRKPAQLSVAGKTLTVLQADSTRLVYTLAE